MDATTYEAGVMVGNMPWAVRPPRTHAHGVHCSTVRLTFISVLRMISGIKEHTTSDSAFGSMPYFWIRLTVMAA